MTKDVVDVNGKNEVGVFTEESRNVIILCDKVGKLQIHF